MNKSFLYILLAAAMLMGCSKERYEDTPVPDEDAWKTDVTLPVPVQFGSIATKAQITDASQLDGKNGYLGILGIDKASTTVAKAKESNLIYNEKASIVNGSVSFFLGKKFYYPMTNEQNFSFYGYYPHLETQHFVQDEKKIIVPQSIIDGSTDIIWAKSSVDTPLEDKYDGYNGRFIRKGGTIPSLSFRHLLTALKFNVIYDASHAPTLDGLPKIKVKEISISNVPTAVQLIVADFSEGNTTEGTLVPVSDPSSKTVTAPSTFKNFLHEIGWRKYEKKISVKQPIGTVMLYTDCFTEGEGTTKEYQASITLQLGEDNTPTESTFSFTVKNPEGFVAGKEYVVNVTVKSATEVSLKADLKNWEGSNMEQDITFGDESSSDTEMFKTINISASKGEETATANIVVTLLTGGDFIQPGDRVETVRDYGQSTTLVSDGDYHFTYSGQKYTMQVKNGLVESITPDQV